jgi:hypothetical protein
MVPVLIAAGIVAIVLLALTMNAVYLSYDPHDD